MRMIRSTPTLCENIVSTNVPQDYPSWLVGTSYAIGDRVTEDDCGTMQYEALTASTGLIPSLNPLAWLPVGVSNSFSMFDTQNVTQTVFNGDIIVEIDIVSFLNSIAFINVSAISARIEIKNTIDITIYDETISFRSFGVHTMYDYYFEPLAIKDNLVVFDLPAVGSGTLKVTIDAGASVGAQSKIGTLTYGQSFNIGSSSYGISVGIKDYSVKTVDGFGNTTFVERGYKRTQSVRVKVDGVGQGVYDVMKVLADYRATPSVYVADNDKEYTILYGVYNKFDILVGNPSFSMCNLQLESMI